MLDWPKSTNVSHNKMILNFLEQVLNMIQVLNSSPVGINAEGICIIQKSTLLTVSTSHMMCRLFTCVPWHSHVFHDIHMCSMTCLLFVPSCVAGFWNNSGLHHSHHRYRVQWQHFVFSVLWTCEQEYNHNKYHFSGTTAVLRLWNKNKNIAAEALKLSLIFCVFW